MVHLYLLETEENQSQAAKALLYKVLARDHHCENVEIMYTDQGKPYLPEGPYISISHSRGYVGVAVADHEIGLDLEVVRPYPDKLPMRIFSPEELSWFRSRQETKADFFTFWTLKESYYKFLGSGLRGFPNGTEFYKDRAWHLRDCSLNFTVLEEKNLLIALCGDKQIHVNLLWE